MLIEKNMYHISIDTDLIKVQILSFQGSGHGVNETKMIATSTCETLKRKLDARFIQCNDAEDMSMEAVKEQIEKFSANR